jgi:hypothetical protein
VQSEPFLGQGHTLKQVEAELSNKKSKKKQNEERDREHQLKALLDENYMAELRARQQKAKELRQFNKRLTAKKLYEADIQADPDFNEKAAKCFEIRAKKMTLAKAKQRQQWEEAVSKDKKYN